MPDVVFVLNVQNGIQNGELTLQFQRFVLLIVYIHYIRALPRPPDMTNARKLSDSCLTRIGP